MTSDRGSPHYPATTTGLGQSLAHGAPGVALQHIERARTGHESWDTARASIRHATSGPIDAGMRAGLYHGAPAITFVLLAAADQYPEYSVAAAALDEHIARLVSWRLAISNERMTRAEPSTYTEFDLFNGITGLCVLLLRSNMDSGLLDQTLQYLVRLTNPYRYEGMQVPGWWVGHDPHQGVPTPGGHANLGMGHGAAGLLAALAGAAIRGYTVDGQHDAIQQLLGLFDQWRQDSAHGPWWPAWITRDNLRTGHVQQGPRRASWCEGTIGICRAQQLGARAVSDPGRQRSAEDHILSSLIDEHLAGLTEPGLCRGLAGVYQTAYRAASDARSPALTARLPELVARLDRLAPSPDAGLLTGEAGIQLARQTANFGPPQSDWDACLLVI